MWYSIKSIDWILFAFTNDINTAAINPIWIDIPLCASRFSSDMLDTRLPLLWEYLDLAGQYSDKKIMSGLWTCVCLQNCNSYNRAHVELHLPCMNDWTACFHSLRDLGEGSAARISMSLGSRDHLQASATKTSLHMSPYFWSNIDSSRADAQYRSNILDNLLQLK